MGGFGSDAADVDAVIDSDGLRSDRLGSDAMRSVSVLSMHTSPLTQPGPGDSGGMNVYVRELSTSLAQRGLDVTVYVRRDSADLVDRVAVEPGLQVVHIDAGPVELPKERLPDVIEEFARGVAADGAAQRSDVIHANYWLSAEAGRQLKDMLDIPLVSTFHTLARVKAQFGDPEPHLREQVEFEVINCCDAICVSNRVEADQLIRLYHADATRIDVVAPGVDHAFFSPGDRAGARAALGMGSDPTLLFVGRIQPLKGLDLAVAALAELPEDVRLVAVGGPSGAEGPAELAKIRNMIDQLGLSNRVSFVPPQPHHLLSTYYRAADVVVVPSRSESFGLVALEAAACGAPVVAAEVGGLRSLVHDGYTGYLIDSRDPIDYAKRIEQILSDTELAGALGRQGAADARRYSWPAAADQLHRLFDEVCSRSLVTCC